MIPDPYAPKKPRAASLAKYLTGASAGAAAGLKPMRPPSAQFGNAQAGAPLTQTSTGYQGGDRSWATAGPQTASAGGPPASPAAPAPAGDPGDPVLTSADYLKESPSFIKAAHDLVVNSGFDLASPEVQAALQKNGLSLKDLGLDAGTMAEAAANPYSVAARLRRQFSSNLSTIGDSTNAHGLLFSGAHNQANANEADAATQRHSGAIGDLLSGLQSDSKGLSDLYDKISQGMQANPVATYGTTSATPTSPGLTADPQAAETARETSRLTQRAPSGVTASIATTLKKKPKAMPSQAGRAL